MLSLVLFFFPWTRFHKFTQHTRVLLDSILRLVCVIVLCFFPCKVQVDCLHYLTAKLQTGKLSLVLSGTRSAWSLALELYMTLPLFVQGHSDETRNFDYFSWIDRFFSHISWHFFLHIRGSAGQLFYQSDETALFLVTSSLPLTLSSSGTWTHDDLVTLRK